MQLYFKNDCSGAIEVKLESSSVVIKEASINLKSISEVIDTKYFKKPSFLMVVTGGKYAYKTEEGYMLYQLLVLKINIKF